MRSGSDAIALVPYVGDLVGIEHVLNDNIAIFFVEGNLVGGQHHILAALSDGNTLRESSSHVIGFSGTGKRC